MVVDGQSDARKWKSLSVALIVILSISAVTSALFMHQISSQLKQLQNERSSEEFLLHGEDNTDSTSFIGFDGESINLPSVLPAAYGAGTLTNVRVSNTNNFFGSTSWYVVSFRTATIGTIESVEMTFPAGFDVSQVRRIDNVGIPDGTMSASGQTVKYTVGSPVSLPANTLVKIMMERIVNPSSAALNQIGVATKNAGNSIIDGPTNSATFVLVPSTLPNSSPLVNAGSDQNKVGTIGTGGGGFGGPPYYILTCSFPINGSVTDDDFTGYLTHDWSPGAFVVIEQVSELSTTATLIFTQFMDFGPITSPVPGSATLTAEDGILEESDSIALVCNPPA